MPQVHSPAPDLPERIRVAAKDVLDARDTYHLAVALRDRLLVDAVDEGFSTRTVAALAGVDRATLNAAIARDAQR